MLVVVPAQSLRQVLSQAPPHLPAGVPLVLCAKGIERDTGRLLSGIAAEACPDNPAATLSGPSFATDVARGMPTAVVVAAPDETMAADLAALLSTRAFRCYSTGDQVGVEIGGALKNVLAIASGAALGAGLGASAQAALVTRGFVELRRIGAAYGALPETLMGLVRPRRPGAHLRLRPVAQLRLRPGAGARRAARQQAAGGRGRDGGHRGAHRQG